MLSWVSSLSNSVKQRLLKFALKRLLKGIVLDQDFQWNDSVDSADSNILSLSNLQLDPKIFQSLNVFVTIDGASVNSFSIKIAEDWSSLEVQLEDVVISSHLPTMSPAPSSQTGSDVKNQSPQINMMASVRESLIAAEEVFAQDYVPELQSGAEGQDQQQEFANSFFQYVSNLVNVSVRNLCIEIAGLNSEVLQLKVPQCQFKVVQNDSSSSYSAKLQQIQVYFGQGADDHRQIASIPHSTQIIMEVVDNVYKLVMEVDKVCIAVALKRLSVLTQLFGRMSADIQQDVEMSAMTQTMYTAASQSVFMQSQVGDKDNLTANNQNQVEVSVNAQSLSMVMALEEDSLSTLWCADGFVQASLSTLDSALSIEFKNVNSQYFKEQFTLVVGQCQVDSFRQSSQQRKLLLSGAALQVENQFFKVTFSQSLLRLDFLQQLKVNFDIDDLKLFKQFYQDIVMSWIVFQGGSSGKVDVVVSLPCVTFCYAVDFDLTCIAEMQQVKCVIQGYEPVRTSIDLIGVKMDGVASSSEIFLCRSIQLELNLDNSGGNGIMLFDQGLQGDDAISHLMVVRDLVNQRQVRSSLNVYAVIGQLQSRLDSDNIQQIIRAYRSIQCLANRSPEKSSLNDYQFGLDLKTVDLHYQTFKLQVDNLRAILSQRQSQQSAYLEWNSASILRQQRRIFSCQSSCLLLRLIPSNIAIAAFISSSDTDLDAVLDAAESYKGLLFDSQNADGYMSYRIQLQFDMAQIDGGQLNDVQSHGKLNQGSALFNVSGNNISANLKCSTADLNLQQNSSPSHDAKIVTVREIDFNFDGSKSVCKVGHVSAGLCKDSWQVLQDLLQYYQNKFIKIADYYLSDNSTSPDKDTQNEINVLQDLEQSVFKIKRTPPQSVHQVDLQQAIEQDFFQIDGFLDVQQMPVNDLQDDLEWVESMNQIQSKSFNSSVNKDGVVKTLTDDPLVVIDDYFTIEKAQDKSQSKALDSPLAQFDVSRIEIRFYDGEDLSDNVQSTGNSQSDLNDAPLEIELVDEDGMISYNELIDDHSSQTSIDQIQSTSGRDESNYVLFTLNDLRLQAGQSEQQQKSQLSITIEQLEIEDHIKSSSWRKFLTRHKGSSNRTQSSSAVSIDVTGILQSGMQTDYRLNVQIQPLRMYVDQDTLRFLFQFFDYKRSAPADISKQSATQQSPLYFQHVHVQSLPLLIDYKPKKVDYARIKQGQYVELLNLFSLEEVAVNLPSVSLRAVNGPSECVSKILQMWIPHVMQHDSKGIVAGITPLRNISNVGSSVIDMVLLPIGEYQRSGRVLSSLQKGSTQLFKTATMETIKLGSKVVSGAQNFLESFDTILSDAPDPSLQRRGSASSSSATSSLNRNRQQQHKVSKMASQPHDYREGLVNAKETIIGIPMRAKSADKTVQVALLRPAIGVSEAIRQTLLGLKNSLDPEQAQHIKDKYKQV
ncbi:hypothetical protein MIR68_006222 [Amoeboaphelidium protococcarum]|nr:hypothetical protein MIR68_006222 [Amoeboaphelidium protococcarum]